MSAEILHFARMTDDPNRIRELRLARGLSQQVVADRVGVSKVTISDLERGKMRLDLEYMRRIGKALGVIAADLLPADVNPWALSEDERYLIEQLRYAAPEVRDQVRRVTDALIPYQAEPRKVA
jgi:transcriptional regulator with XRE-family HTH domain